MGSKVVWKQQDLKFVGVSESGAEVSLGSSSENGEAMFSPMELLGVSLAGCTGMDVLSILKKKKQDVTDFEIRVNTKRAEDHPRYWTWVQIEFIVTGRNIDPTAVERAMELSTEKYCSVMHTIDKSVKFEKIYKIVEV